MSSASTSICPMNTLVITSCSISRPSLLALHLQLVWKPPLQCLFFLLHASVPVLTDQNVRNVCYYLLWGTENLLV